MVLHQIAARVAILPAVLMLIFLFVGSIDHLDNRMIKEAWESGHFFLFACLTYIACHLDWAKNKRIGVVFIYILLGSIILGLLTEVLQLIVGRSFESDDLYRDIIGGIAGFTFSRIGIRESFKQNLAYGTLCILLLVLGLQQFLIVSYDTYQTKKNAPVLSDFETPFELTRWIEMGTKHEITKSVTRNGNKALKVIYEPGKHPHAVLREMKWDWRNFQHLHMSIFNSQQGVERLIIIVHDHDSRRNIQDYQMRFDREYQLKQGWNDIVISLTDIKMDPKDRQLDMSRIYSISFVMPKPTVSKTLYLDNLYLSN